MPTRWLEQVLDETEGLDERTRQRAEFYLKQLASALSPSNFPMTNPVVLRETLASNGRNLLHGMANFMRDLEKSGDRSEEHTSELQSLRHLVCRLLLEKKK